MSMPVGVWAHYGYRSSPYSTSALRVGDADEMLLVGRESELKMMLRDLASGTQMIALEGDYGVGKSSLAAVATSQAASWKTRDTNAPLFLASGVPLELEENDTASKLEKRAYYQVAGAILARADQLTADGFRLQQVNELRRWLRTPEGGGWSAGIGVGFPAVVSANLSAGRNRGANTGAGFSDSGVITLLDAWLEELFPTSEDGGVILLLDNLEVLSRYANAINLFESLRDRLFKRKGLRWIIGGAEGMVRAALGTPKMSGVFPEPIDIAPLPHTRVREVVAKREVALRSRGDASLPVSPGAFEASYAETGQNLRTALGLAERFSLRTDPSVVLWVDGDGRDDLYATWRKHEGQKVIEQLAGKVTKTGWRVLTALVREMDGAAAPGQYEAFGYKAMGSLLPQIQALAKLGLLNYTVDEGDGRRRLISATENGRLAVASRPHGESALPPTQ